MSTLREDPIWVEIILDETGRYRRLMPTQLRSVPVKGDFYEGYTQIPERKVLEIKNVIHSDIRIILVVVEAEDKLQNVLNAANEKV